MARLEETLRRNYADCPDKGIATTDNTGAPLSDAAAYPTLWWGAGNPRPKPSLATLQTEGSALDSTIAAEQAQEDAQNRLQAVPDGVLRGLEALTARVDELSTRHAAHATALAELKTKIKIASLSSALAYVVSTAAWASAGFDTLKTRLAAIRSNAGG